MRADRPGGDRDLRYRRARPRRHPGARPGLPSDPCLRARAREAFDATPRAPRARERVPQMTGRGAVRRRAHGRALLWLVLANVALMLADATANLLVVLPLLVVSQLGRGYVLAGLLAPLVLTCLQLLVYIDRKIFALFRFHLNGLVVNTLTTPGGWDSMHVRQAELALWIALALALLAVEYAAYAGLVRRFLAAEPVRSSRRGWLVLVTAVAALGVA